MGIQAIGSRNITFDPGSSGQSNQTVMDVQHALNQIDGTPRLEENGVFDRDTERAVRDFQGSHRLPETGVIDQETIGALNTQVDLQQRATCHEGATAAGPAATLPEEERGRRIQELRIQEPAIRQDLEARAGSGGVDYEPAAPMQTHYEITPHELGTEQYNTAAQALQDPNPHRLRVGGHDFSVCGATDREAQVIRNTLEALPPSHLDRIPPTITVSQTLSNNRVSGGAQYPQDPEHPRLELSRRSLANASDRVGTAQGHGVVSSTMLHEAGHLVGSGMYGNQSEAYRSAPYGALQDLPADVPDSARDPESRRRIEQYAQAYMMYFGGSDRRFPGGLTEAQRSAMHAHFQAAGIPAE